MTGDFYQKRRGWIHRLDPRCSLLFSLILLVQVFFLQSLWTVGVAFLFVHLLLLSGSIPLKVLFRLWKIVLPLMVVIFILWPLFNRQGQQILWQWRFITITGEALLSGALTALRLPVLLLISYIPLLTQRQNRLIRGWVGLGIPYKIGLVFLLTLRFLPYFRESFEQIEQAQQMRGLTGQRGIKGRLPVLVTLIVWALRSSENLGYALETRGLGLHKKPSHLVELKFRWFDLLVLLLTLIISFALILYI